MSDKKKLAIAVTALSDINRVQRRDFDMTTIGAISAKAFADMAKIKPLKEAKASQWPFPTPQKPR